MTIMDTNYVRNLTEHYRCFFSRSLANLKKTFKFFLRRKQFSETFYSFNLATCVSILATLFGCFFLSVSGLHFAVLLNGVY